MKKLTISEAFNELKNIDTEIKKAINCGIYVSTCKINENDPVQAAKNQQTAKDIEKSFNDVTFLIKKREQLKSAIIKSNGETYVFLDNQKITVATLIDLISNLKYKIQLTKTLSDQFEKAQIQVKRNNEYMENKLDDLTKTAFSRDNNNKIKADDYSSIADPYRKANEFSLVDPINIEKTITENEEYIDELTAKADTLLQVSNSTTTIEIDE